MSPVLGGRAAAFPRAGRASPEYRKAFEDYLRYGEPIDFAALRTLEGKAGRVSADRPTTHYIWRTRGDGKVRPSHAANKGKIFAWDDPPPTGHPGEEYGCRCWAEAYLPDVQEVFDITMQNVSDEGPPWTSEDFIRHYFFGEGRPVTVRQTGHLRAVVAEFRRQAGDVPTRLPGQIADVARKNIGGHFDGGFGRPYPMKDVVFSLGNTTIGGVFRGTCKLKHALLELNGTINFELSDEFRDPLDIEEQILERIGAVGTFPTEFPTAEPYRIDDRWREAFSARLYVDRARSAYRHENPR